MTLNPKTMARLDSKVRRSGDDECWPWLGRVTPRGTPHMHYGKVNGSTRTGSPRRLVWERAFGSPPDAKRKVRMTCGDAVCMNPRHMKSPDVEGRFWPKVNKNGPVPQHRPELGQCWLWTGHRDKKGYGVIYRDVGLLHLLTHRLAWELAYGPIEGHVPGDPEKEVLVMHECDNPACVRPEHLRLGTDADNIADCIAKGRFSRGVKHSDAIRAASARRSA